MIKTTKIKFIPIIINHRLSMSSSHFWPHVNNHAKLSSVAGLAASLIADPGGVSLIPAWPDTFMEINHVDSPPSADSRRAVNYQLQLSLKYVH